jgi:hypothetical protein
VPALIAAQLAAQHERRLDRAEARRHAATTPRSAARVHEAVA